MTIQALVTLAVTISSMLKSVSLIVLPVLRNKNNARENDFTYLRA